MKRRRRLPRSSSTNWEAAWLGQMHAAGLPQPVREYRGIVGRQFRFDFAWPGIKLAAECEGGLFMRRQHGGHATPLGISRDIEKYNLAALQGWKVIRATSTQIRDGLAIQWLAAAHGIELPR
jgi:very-short-patch-repair endonuclease